MLLFLGCLYTSTQKQTQDVLQHRNNVVKTYSFSNHSSKHTHGLTIKANQFRKTSKKQTPLRGYNNQTKTIPDATFMLKKQS